MRSSTFLIAFSGLVASVVAQNGTAGTNFTINVSSVTLQQRATWCQGETNTCTLLCPVSPRENTCSPDTLEFSCICQNGTAPGLEYYTQTMPTFICEQAFTECINSNVGNKLGQDACETDIRANCGTLKAGPQASTTAPTTTPSPTTSGAGTAATTTSSTAGAVPTGMVYYGNGAAAAVAIGLFAYLV